MLQSILFLNEAQQFSNYLDLKRAFCAGIPFSAHRLEPHAHDL